MQEAHKQQSIVTVRYTVKNLDPPLKYREPRQIWSYIEQPLQSDKRYGGCKQRPHGNNTVQTTAARRAVCTTQRNAFQQITAGLSALRCYEGYHYQLLTK